MCGADWDLWPRELTKKLCLYAVPLISLLLHLEMETDRNELIQSLSHTALEITQQVFGGWKSDNKISAQSAANSHSFRPLNVTPVECLNRSHILILIYLKPCVFKRERGYPGNTSSLANLVIPTCKLYDRPIPE